MMTQLGMMEEAAAIREYLEGGEHAAFRVHWSIDANVVSTEPSPPLLGGYGSVESLAGAG